MTKQAKSSDFIPGKLIVRLTEEALQQQRTVKESVSLRKTGRFGIDKLDAVMTDCACQIVDPVFKKGKYERLSGIDLENYFVIHFSEDADLDPIIERLEQSPEIASVEREPVTEKDQAPNDPRFTNGDQWHLPQIEIEDAWRVSQGEGTIIGIYDVDGVHCEHEDLDAHRVEVDCGGENEFDDDHGTKVAGVCAAVTDNNLGVAGAGWDAQFIGLKSSGASNNANAIRCLVDEDSDVIVTSSPIKRNSEPSTLRNAVRYAYRSGVLIIASAGNAQNPIPYTQWPAANSRTLSVGNSDQNDARSGTSNYGPWLDVMAPGVGIWTTDVNRRAGRWRDAYDSPSGTSFSTPLVGGVAALMLAHNGTIGPRQVKEIVRQTCIIPDGTDTSDSRYGNGRINARKAMLATQGLWKTVRYGAVPKVGAATAINETGWWIVAYSKSVFVGYKNRFWRKMVFYNSVADAEPTVAINNNGDWIVNYSRSTFVGYRTYSAVKMVTYPRRRTPGAVAINENGDWIAVYSKSTFVGHKTTSVVKMVYYNRVPDVPGHVAINDRGDWICIYSKSTFVGYKTSSSAKMVYYNSVPDAAGKVDINSNGDWIVNYSKSTFVGYKTRSARKMVYYSRRQIHGDVTINDRGDWICVYSRSTFVGYKTSSSAKMVYYNRVADAPGAVAINGNGDWIVNYSKSTFVGYRTASTRKMVYYPKRRVGGDVAINENGDWIAVYSMSTFIGHETAWASKRVFYNSVPKVRGSVSINNLGDWISLYSRTTFVGNARRSAVQAVRHAPDDMSKRDIEDGFAYPPSTLPDSPGAVAMNNNGEWVACYGRSASIGDRELFTNTHRFDT